MLCGLLSVDIILLVTWQIVDPLRRKIETFSLELPPFGDDEDAMIKPELEHCSSEQYSLWIGKYAPGREKILLIPTSKIPYANRHCVPCAQLRKKKLQIFFQA